ncbi:cupin domain-containing protein [Natribaculum luteum]|uniref:Cupin domain-containing protein n=1 Tax=Natribaculum luteum TaxID=1586232 RepID=A0ABD5P3B9_9EURY|nr:cupin domain-containing protein [Natribaculum luteum]
MSDNSDDYFVGSEDVSTQVFDWGTLKWMATPDVNDSERLSAGVVQLEPGRGHELHTHPDSDEVLYVVSGEGEQTVAGETREVAAGEMIYIPADVEHGTQNTGWETLKLLAVYAPPGPEDVLAEMPECTVVPAGEFPEQNE